MIPHWKLATLAFAILGMAACQPASRVSENIESEILSRERLALDEWARGNPTGYIQTFADDVTYFDDIGAQSRVDGIDEMRTYTTSLKIPAHQYEIIDPKVQSYGDLAILTLQYHASDSDGKPLVQWKATSVYRRLEGEWRIVHAHWSKVKA